MGRRTLAGMRCQEGIHNCLDEAPAEIAGLDRSADNYRTAK